MGVRRMARGAARPGAGRVAAFGPGSARGAGATTDPGPGVRPGARRGALSEERRFVGWMAGDPLVGTGRGGRPGALAGRRRRGLLRIAAASLVAVMTLAGGGPGG